eukprot:TRINITY_DN23248_c0_g1_i1.p2 TRINITY_DN23248_c0_g1~~TRINITY_DN23248_c0_g1_i1.p2  ORF type:complete len:259 (+),score=37.01 TRINITY_DN23248_c0_g1_i1:93-869(+)
MASVPKAGMSRLPPELVADALAWLGICADLRKAAAVSRAWRRALSLAEPAAQLRARNPFGHLDGVWVFDSGTPLAHDGPFLSGLLELDLSEPDTPRARQAAQWDESRPPRCQVGYRADLDSDPGLGALLRGWYAEHDPSMRSKVHTVLRLPGLWHRLRSKHPPQRVAGLEWLRDVAGRPGCVLVVTIGNHELELQPREPPPPEDSGLSAGPLQRETQPVFAKVQMATSESTWRLWRPRDRTATRLPAPPPRDELGTGV